MLLRVYPLQPADVAQSLRVLVAAANVEVNRSAVEVGPAMLTAGGDFADGVIALEEQWLGGETFVSFDNKAVAWLVAQGKSARLMGLILGAAVMAGGLVVHLTEVVRHNPDHVNDQWAPKIATPEVVAACVKSASRVANGRPRRRASSR